MSKQLFSKEGKYSPDFTKKLLGNDNGMDE